LPRADHDTARQHREYIHRLMDHLRMKQTPLAKAAGVQPSSLSRVLKEDGTGTLHGRNITRLEKYSGIKLSAVFDAPPASGPRGLAEDAVRFDAESVRTSTSGIGGILRR
jgi:hypothetical protein